MPEKTYARSKRLTRKEVRELDVKITFMEGVVRRDPRYVEALQILGDFEQHVVHEATLEA